MLYGTAWNFWIFWITDDISRRFVKLINSPTVSLLPSPMKNKSALDKPMYVIPGGVIPSSARLRLPQFRDVSHNCSRSKNVPLSFFVSFFCTASFVAFSLDSSGVLIAIIIATTSEKLFSSLPRIIT